MVAIESVGMKGLWALALLGVNMMEMFGLVWD
jgi:hypothetical protein